MKLHCLQHVPFEGPAWIADWAAIRKIALQTVAVYAGRPLPDPADFDFY